MDAHRPRLSILTIFDPLSVSPNSFPDKENNPGDSSFFHPHGLSNARTPVQPTFRRRLIDIGDITIDEPDIQDLLAEEEEFEHELNCSLAAGDDDNDTLTFRDMVKAATPKWTGRHYASLTTSKSSPTPRTPLAEMSFKDEKTPMARKKPYRRSIPAVASKLTQVDFAEASIEDVLPPTIPIKVPSEAPHSPWSMPPTELSSHDPQRHHNIETSNRATAALSSSVSTLNLPALTGPLIAGISIPRETPETSAISAESLGSSVCTLNLPPPAGTLIADTSIPISVSPASPQGSPNLSLPSPANSQARLRPNAHFSNNSNRHSVDLQSSFQLHLTSSDATFDLLNEKISFFNSKDGNSFLNMDLDGSFGEDDFALAKDGDLKAREPGKAGTISKFAKSSPQPIKGHKPTTNGHTSSRSEAVSIYNDSIEISKPEDTSACERVFVKRSTSRSSSTLNREESKERVAGGSRALPTSKDLNPTSPRLTKDITLLSTPSSSSILQLPPRAVPALKIVKRSKFQFLANPQPNPSTTSTHTRRTSIATDAPPPTSKNLSRSPSTRSTISLSECKQNDGLPPTRGLKRIGPIQAIKSVPTSTDGPRRVPISEGPKLNSGTNVRAPACIDQSNSTNNGPRRILVATAPSAVKPLPVPASRSAAQSHSGLKQPAKYGTLQTMPALSKPTARAAGSNLPGPSSSKTRLGVTMTGSAKLR